MNKMKKQMIEVKPGMRIKMRSLTKLRRLDDYGIPDDSLIDHAGKWYTVKAVASNGDIILFGDEMGYWWPLMYFDAIKWTAINHDPHTTH